MPSPSAEPGAADRRLVWRVSAGVGLSVTATNLVGVVAVFAFAVWVLPSEPIADEDHAISLNLVLASIWAPLPSGLRIGARSRSRQSMTRVS